MFWYPFVGIIKNAVKRTYKVGFKFFGSDASIVGFFFYWFIERDGSLIAVLSFVFVKFLQLAKVWNNVGITDLNFW